VTEARVIQRAYGRLGEVEVAQGVAFFIDPSVLEALFGVAYTEAIVRAWDKEGALEGVVDDLALAIADGRACLCGAGTKDDPYRIEVRGG
jgi:hypothetical protein